MKIILSLPNIGLAEDSIAQISDLLSVLLADEMVLLVKTKHFHWNVRGPHFKEYHELFDEHAALLNSYIDELAERIRMLGISSPGAMSQFLELATLEENHQDSPSAQAMLMELTDGHEHLIRSLRAGIELSSSLGDEGNADIMTAIMEAHEKMAWMLRSSAA
ncbi:MAG: DNA starvation/stationary phase protection protein [Bacteroidota bacterium]